VDERFNSWAREHLTGKQSRLKFFLRTDEMLRQLQRAATGLQEAADKSWLLIVLETWLREFDVDVAAEIPSSDAAALAG
jgi:hypothetical protein